MPLLDDAAVGDRLPEHQVTLDQLAILRYAGASGDFNPLHWDPAIAERVSPTGTVIAHGMLNLGLVSAAVTAWAGGPQYVRSLTGSFKAPCPVDSTVTIGGEIVAIDPDAGIATLSVWVRTEDGKKVVDPRGSRAVVALDRT